MIERLLSYFISAQTARDEEGQTVIEYALILAFVALVAVGIGAGGALTGLVGGAFDGIEALFGG